MTDPKPTSIRCDRPDCRCGEGRPVPIDAERLRKLRSLRDGLQRNTVAITRIIDQLIAEGESQDRDRAA